MIKLPDKISPNVGRFLSRINPVRNREGSQRASISNRIKLKLKNIKLLTNKKEENKKMQNIIKQLNKEIKRSLFKKLLFKFSKNSFYVALSILVIFYQFSFPKVANATSGVIPIGSTYADLTITAAASITATGTTAATNSITVTGTLTINSGVTLTLISYNNGDANYTNDSGVIINAGNIVNNGIISANGK